jgi:hypothetical protein
VEDKIHVHDLHASTLHLMGVDHTKLVYHHKGRPERIRQKKAIRSPNCRRSPISKQKRRAVEIEQFELQSSSGVLMN